MIPPIALNVFYIAASAIPRRRNSAIPNAEISQFRSSAIPQFRNSSGAGIPNGREYFPWRAGAPRRRIKDNALMYSPAWAARKDQVKSEVTGQGANAFRLCALLR
jgi:hypothetical protein